MFLFIFIYLFLLKYLIKLCFGNYKKSFSSYFFIPLIFLKGDNILDILLLILSSCSAIHHSVRCDSPIFHKITHLLDSMAIVFITSYLLFKYFNINTIYNLINSTIISLFSFYIDNKYNNRSIKKIIILICYSIFIYNYGIYGIILSLTHIYFFKKGKYWDTINFYRYSWHFTSAFIFFLMINIIY